MKQLNPGERVRQFREYLDLSQEAFGAVINMSRGNISKIESGKIPMSNAFLYGMMIRFAANTEWIMTGKGEMFIVAEDYIVNGIKLLGAKKFSEGLVKVLEDPQFAEFRSHVALEKLATGNTNQNLLAYVEYILNQGLQSDEKIRNWLMVQLERAFPEVLGEKEK
ncbi:helix-turn-helix protein [Hydrogenispora ethanolica]|uniref:Helix-turn-helix protein n=1 Tax=Hydrogenispora ethanolica TaxID=1082276 RepID=A0A4R1R9E0_HYDET|nr:helix-turn-helix transcriptional regulator [Hydrogenispora ethanolica]TCL62321.1 helix-turn-helix protein [Hydrogenispora ethanolica]